MNATPDRRQLLEQALRQVRDTRARLEAVEQARHEPIAVLGAGIRAPGGVEDLDGFWRLLRSGTDAVGPVGGPDGRSGDHAGDAGWAGLLDRIDEFDAGFFGMSGPEADRLDPQQRLLAEVTWEAIEDAGLPLPRLQAVPTGVFVGIYGTDYMSLQLGDPDSINAYTAPGSAHSVAANRLSYLLDLHGPSFAVDTACSSSLIAVHLAVRALRDGDCELAVVAGVNAILSPLSTAVTGKVLPIAPGGRCRTFDADADGIVRAEGCGVLVLQRASEAARQGRTPRALIRGTAINHDGRTNGLTAPSPRSQARLLRSALADGRSDPADVVYVEAHGTGTALGDPIEVEAVREVYGHGERPCALGSVKTNFGHQEAAAGITGLIKAMLVLEHGEVPPHLHLRRLNPEIDLTGSRLDVPTTVRPLPPGHRLAAVSSFGFGGANAHVVLSGPAGSDPGGRPAPDRGVLVLPLSARDGAALRALAGRYADRLEAAPSDAARVAAAAAAGRTQLSHRNAVVAGDAAELVRRLRALAASAAEPAGGGSPAGRPPRVAFVYSGQGCQWPGMGRALLDHEPVARAELELCDTVVREIAGWSLLEELRAGDGNRLDRTEIAQVAIGAVQLALTRLWLSWGVRPVAVTGHSMGEIVAACAAGALDRRTALQLLVTRARLTESGARGGRMHSIGLPPEQVERLLAAAATGDRPIAVAAVNGPASTVVSGDPEAVAAVVAQAERAGVLHRALAVEYGFHSPLLDEAAGQLAEAVTGLRAEPERLALYSTVTGGRIRAAQLDPAHWARNLRDAVLFRPAVEALLGDGVTALVEVGPHPVLLRNVGEVVEAAGGGRTVLASLRRNTGLEPLYRSLAALWAAGADLDWTVPAGRPDGRVALPHYPWQRRRHWLPEPAPDARPVPLVRPRARPGHPARAEPVGNPVPEGTPPSRHAELTGYVRAKLARALGASGAHDVPADGSLEALGLDSLAVVELKNQIQRELGVTVPLPALLESTTPSQLGGAILAALEAGAVGQTAVGAAAGGAS